MFQVPGRQGRWPRGGGSTDGNILDIRIVTQIAGNSSIL